MEACTLCLGTEDGVRVLALDQSGAVRVTAEGLRGNAIRAICPHPERREVLFAGGGLRGWGLHVSQDLGRTFETAGFEDRWVWDVAIDPADPTSIYVGTEPPMVWISRDGGRTFEPSPAIEELPSRSRWTFFYEPFQAGHVHGFGLHPARPHRVVAGVEVGGVIISEDDGATWRNSLVGHDFHRVAPDASDPDRILAATGEGPFRSSDAGVTWPAVPSLVDVYLHAVFFEPDDPARVFALADEEGVPPVRRSEDGGTSWELLGAGLPPPGAADTLALHPSHHEVLVYGRIAEGRGRLFASADSGTTWDQLDADGLPKPWRLRVLRAS